MKKTISIALPLIVFLIAFFVPFNQHKTLIIKTQYFIILQQLLQPNNWKRWQPDVKQAWQKDSSTVKITQYHNDFIIRFPGSVLKFKVTDSGFSIDKNSNGKNSISNFRIIPATQNGTAIATVFQKTSFSKLFFNFLGYHAENDVDVLKKFLEDTHQLYGFDIRRTTVTDSNVVVEKRLVSIKNKVLEIAQTKQDLKEFITQHQLKIVQPVIADIRPAGKDSVRIMIGLPVDKQTVSVGKVKFMQLPPHGRMLTGLYTGRYSGRQKLYLAMKTYMADHNLSSPEDAYEKYLDNKIPLNDTSFVRLQVNFPIY